MVILYSRPGTYFVATLPVNASVKTMLSTVVFELADVWQLAQFVKFAWPALLLVLIVQIRMDIITRKLNLIIVVFLVIVF